MSLNPIAASNKSSKPSLIGFRSWRFIWAAIVLSAMAGGWFVWYDLPAPEERDLIERVFPPELVMIIGGFFAAISFLSLLIQGITGKGQ